MVWDPTKENILSLPDDTLLRYPAGMSLDDANRDAMKNYPHLYEEVPSGLVPSIASTWERMKGAAAAAPDVTLGALGDREELLRSAQETYKEAGKAAREYLPEPAQWEDIGKAWEEEGFFPAAAEAWTFAKESVGQSVPYMGPGYVAGKIGASDLVAKTSLGRGVASAISKAVPALRVGAGLAPHPIAKVALGAFAGMGTLALQFYADNLQRQVEVGGEDVMPSDISVFTAGAAAVPQAGMEYLFIALMGGIGAGPQRASAQAISKSLAVGSTAAGRKAFSATTKTALESLTEFPTELAQTILERAQAGESISFEDAEFVREMWDTVAGTLPVAGLFGAAGTYRAHRAEKSTQKNWDKMSQEEKRRRVQDEGRRENNRGLEIERAILLQDQNEQRWENAKEEARRNNDIVKLRALEAAGRAPVTIADVIQAADSRNILTNRDGFASFVRRQTRGRTSDLNETTPFERRRIRSVLSGLKVYEYAENKGGVDLPLFSPAQFDEAVKKTKNVASLDQSAIRKALDLGNKDLDKNIARGILDAMEDRGYAVRPTKGKKRPLRPRNPGYTEAQYNEVVRQSQEKGRVTQEMVEQATRKYGPEAYHQFLNSMRVRGDLPGSGYAPTTLRDARKDGDTTFVGTSAVTVEDTKGYFIRNQDGEIVGGSTNRNDALAESRRLKKRTRSYSIKKNGQVIKTLKNSVAANTVFEDMKKGDPDANWAFVSNPPMQFSVDHKRNDGFKIVERLDEEGKLRDVEELGFSPSLVLAEDVRDNRIKDMTPGQSDWEIRGERHRRESEVELRKFLEGRGARFEEPAREEFFPPVNVEEEARNSEVLGIVAENLAAAGLGEDVLARVVNRIGATGGAEGAFDPNVYTISVALEEIADAKTPQEVRARVSDIMNHETMHAMRALDLFTENEWSALENATTRIIDNRGKTFLETAERKYEGREGYETRQSVVEEAVSELYRQFHTDPNVQRQLTGEPTTLVERMQRFMERMFNAFSGIGFADAGDVLRGMGVVRGRERGEVRTLKDTREDLERKRVLARRQREAEKKKREEGEAEKPKKLSVGREEERDAPQKIREMIESIDVPRLPEDASRYFNLPEETVFAPIGNLRATHKPGKGFKNANRFMGMAYRGETEKRDPISLRDNGDGTYDVLDGNATYANALASGWKELPGLVKERKPRAAEGAKFSNRISTEGQNLADLHLESGTSDAAHQLFDPTGDAAEAAATNFDLDTVRDSHVQEAREVLYQVAQRSLADRGMQGRLTVYRAGPTEGRGVVNVTTDRRIAEYFEKTSRTGRKVESYEIDSRDVLYDTEVRKGTYAEDELLVYPESLVSTPTPTPTPRAADRREITWDDLERVASESGEPTFEVHRGGRTARIYKDDGDGAWYLEGDYQIGGRGRGFPVGFTKEGAVETLNLRFRSSGSFTARDASSVALKLSVPEPSIGSPVIRSGLSDVEAGAVETQMKESQAGLSLDERMRLSEGDQRSLGNAAEQIAEYLGPDLVHLMNPGMKTKESIENKKKKKKYDVSKFTDIVRLGFVVDNPEQADVVSDLLSRQFPVYDEGWNINQANYFDRKLLVKLPNGTVGEVQFWEPHLLMAKESQLVRDLIPDRWKDPWNRSDASAEVVIQARIEGGWFPPIEGDIGHQLYDQVSELEGKKRDVYRVWETSLDAIESQMRGLYDGALLAASQPWKSLADMLRPSNRTMPGEMGVQPSGLRTQPPISPSDRAVTAGLESSEAYRSTSEGLKGRGISTTPTTRVAREEGAVNPEAAKSYTLVPGDTESGEGSVGNFGDRDKAIKFSIALSAAPETVVPSEAEILVSARNNFFNILKKTDYGVKQLGVTFEESPKWREDQWNESQDEIRKHARLYHEAIQGAVRGDHVEWVQLKDVSHPGWSGHPAFDLLERNFYGIDADPYDRPLFGIGFKDGKVPRIKPEALSDPVLDVRLIRALTDLGLIARGEVTGNLDALISFRYLDPLLAKLKSHDSDVYSTLKSSAYPQWKTWNPQNEEQERKHRSKGRATETSRWAASSIWGSLGLDIPYGIFPSNPLVEQITASLGNMILPKVSSERGYRLFRGGNLNTFVKLIRDSPDTQFSIDDIYSDEFEEWVKENGVGKDISIDALAEFSANPFISETFAEAVTYVVNPGDSSSYTDPHSGGFQGEMGHFLSGSFIVTDVAVMQVEEYGAAIGDWSDTLNSWYTENLSVIEEEGYGEVPSGSAGIVDATPGTTEGDAMIRELRNVSDGSRSPYYDSEFTVSDMPRFVVLLEQVDPTPAFFPDPENDPSLSSYERNKKRKDDSPFSSPERHLRFSLVDVDKPGWSQVGPQAGSNFGGTYRNEVTGEEYYVKTPDDPEVARNEVLAAKLYRAAGVNVPEVSLAILAGNESVASLIVPGLDRDEKALRNGEVSGVASGFAADAWLGNWDVVGLEFDNLLVKDGRAYRIDTGGSMVFRAQGGLKNDLYEGAWGPVVSELETLRGLDPNVENENAELVFSYVTDSDIVNGIDRILEIPIDEIDSMIDSFGPFDPMARFDLLTTLEERRDYLAQVRTDLSGERSVPNFYETLQWKDRGNERQETASVKAFPVLNALDKVGQTTNQEGLDRDTRIVSALGNFSIERRVPFDPNETFPSGWGDIDPEARNSFGVAVIDKSGNVVLREVENHFDGYHWSFAKGRMDEGELPIQTAVRELQEEMGIGPETPGFEIVGVLPGRYPSGFSDTYFYVAQIDGAFPDVRPDWVDPGADGTWASQLMDETPGYVPKVSTRAPGSQDARPVLREVPGLTERSRAIARGEIRPKKLSVSDSDRVELDRDSLREKGSRVYEDLRAAISAPFVHKSLWDHIREVVENPKLALAWIRQKFVDKYEGIRRVSEKAQALKGDDRFLLADVNALAAAYMSDRAVGVVEQAITSGQPIFKNGIASTDTTKKGLLEIISPLLQGDTDLIRDWHLWMVMNRERRFGSDGKLTQTSAAERETINRHVRDSGWLELFESVNQDYQAWNESVVNFMRDTGVINDGMAEVFKSYGDYIPFFREFEGEADARLTAALQELAGSEIERLEVEGRIPVSSGRERMGAPSSMFSSLTGARPPKRAKGGESMTVDPLTGMLRNLQAAITSGMKNVAAVRTMDDAVLVDMAELVSPEEKGRATHTVRVEGEDKHYIVYDELLHDSLTGMLDGRVKYLDFFAAPASFLREMVTRSPDFIIANLMRDSMSTWITSGVSTKGPVGTMTNFIRGGITGGEGSEAYQALKSAGVIGGFDFGRDIKDFRKTFDKRLREQGISGGKRPGFWNMGKKLWDWSGDVTTKSDAATRMAVYDDVLSRTMEMGYSREQAETEAIYQALEVINFSRRGNSTLAKIITAVIPFMNARVQGLDVLWRAGRGRYSADVSKVAKNRALVGFLSRGSLLAFSSIAYSMMMHDEDEWKNARPEEKDDNWILPGWGDMPGFKIPIPFEVGVIFKTIPERIYRYVTGEQDTRQTVNSLKRSLVTTFEFNIFGPQITKPVMETMMNHSFFTGRDIVPYFMKDYQAREQYRVQTNEFAKSIGDAFNVSPIKVEHLLRGYTGTLGSYLMVGADWVARNVKGVAPRPSLRADQMIMARRFLQSTEGAEGQEAEWYDFTNATRAITSAFSKRIRDQDIEGARKIYEKNKGAFAVDSMRKAIDKQMDELRVLETQILLAPETTMNSEQKLEQINRIDHARKAILVNAQKIRDMADLPTELPFPLSAFNR